MGSATRQALGSEQPLFLTFAIADDEYGIAIRQVREILEYPKVTRVPQTPSWTRGVMNLRGSVVPVLDLRAKFGLGASPLTRKTCVIVLDLVLRGETSLAAVIADTVHEVLELVEVQAPPAFGTRVRPEYLLGVAASRDRVACLLDVERVLSTNEILDANPHAAATAEREGPHA